MKRLALAACLVLTACQQTPSVLENSLSKTALAGDSPFEVAAQGPVTTPAMGGAEPLVLITTFEDFQCPFCRTVSPALERVINAYPEDIQAHFRHRPLSFHQLALPLARASMAAHRQGKFKTFKDLFFSRLHLLDKNEEGRAAIDDHAFRTRLVTLATNLGLDGARFAADLGVPEPGKRSDPTLGNKEVTDKIAQDNAKGILLGARGTPSVFINGRLAKLTGSSQGRYEGLMRAVREELKAAKKLEAAGVPRHQVVAQRIAFHQPDVENAAAWLLDNADIPAAKLPAITKSDQPKGSVPREAVQVPIPEGAPMKGAVDDALVTIVEFSDFQCPFCSRVNPTIEGLLKEYPKDVRVVFVNLPLGFHKEARPAAIAALCAHEQGKFWPYHDELFANMSSLKEPGIFTRLAGTVGLDAAEFATCRTAGNAAKRVDADLALAAKVGVRGTPNLFINGRRARGALPLGQLRGVVEEEIKKATPIAAKVGRGDALYKALMKGAKAAPSSLSGETVAIDLSKAPRLGPEDAPVKVAVFSDFECPYCSKVAKPLHDFVKAMPGKVSVHFKHFPLGFHKKAEPAAIASVCAQRQGKFWPYHDKIFGSDLTAGTLDAAARFVGLDMAAYTACKSDPSARAVVLQDMADGRKAGVGGTPSIYVNGQKYGARASVASLKAAAKNFLK